MVTRSAFTCAIMAIAAAVIGPPAVATADRSEDYFLSELHKTGQKWFWPYGEAHIIALGREVCDAWAVGTAYPDKIDSLSTEKGWTHRNTRYFVALSTGTFCPDLYSAVVVPQDRPSDGSAARR